MPLICLWNSVLESWVLNSPERNVTILVTYTDMVLTSASQLVLSISMIILTISPGLYPSFSNDIIDEVCPFPIQQQLVISPVECCCWLCTTLVSLSMISRPPMILNCGVRGSIAATM